MIELTFYNIIAICVFSGLFGCLIGLHWGERYTMRLYGLDKKSQERKKELLKDAPEELKHKILVHVIHTPKPIGWISGKVECDICSHNWIAAYPEDTDKLECPNCQQLAHFELIEIAE